MKKHPQKTNFVKLIKFFYILLFVPLNYIYGNNYSLGDNLYEYWQRFNWTMWENDPYIFRTYVELRSGNIGHNGLRSIFLSEQFAYKVTKKVTMELHYTFIQNRPIDSDYWIWHHRLEIEANRIFNFGKMKLDTRNRLEIRQAEDNLKVLYRLRQRTMFVFPIENMKVLKFYTIHNELFYDLSTSLFNEDRFSPLTFTLAISEKTNLDVFFMIKFFLHNKLWDKSLVFGTQLNF